MSAQTDWLSLLHKAGCRVTAPREAVITAIQQATRPLGIYELHSLARDQYPYLGLVTVYRTVEKLIELNLVQRIHQPDGQHTYLPIANPNQHMLLCQGCGHVAFFEGDISSLAESISRKTGYQLDLSLVQFLGLCADCLHQTKE
jgi:Fe2+ or Zn2+ uptake regulation protein